MTVHAKISELKNRLSRYLARVRRGESVLVLDRHRVIARIEPAGRASAAATPDADWIDELERRGVLRRAVSTLPRDWLARRPEVHADVVQALLQERAESR
jgi:antitoxin (DNA-binding transcriptional repressor) of toxin-antitoxin stability system